MAREPAQDGMTQAGVIRSMKARIMAGEFPAGMKLRPDALRGAYDVSASAMREALLRLSAEGLLAQEEQRGFHIPEADPKLLEELMDLRVLIEGEGAVQSMRQGDMEWEADLAAAHHKLAHIEGRMAEAEDHAPLVPIWTRVDWEFHQTLLSACPSGALRDAHRAVYERFRQQVVAATPDAGFRHETIREHEEIVNAAVARDEAALRLAIKQHLWTYREDMVGA